ncbi:mitochondrial phosphate carrier protein 3 [Quercus suber]|uniref:Mitochondrial phosphate carrier protein 3 n=1 Tax=Quercus suber TaxID=58331 RepID=A0AAW0KNJ8_QUESU
MYWICSSLVLAPSEPGKIEMYSPTFYAAYTTGGILSCGLTHMAVTPLDLVKCNMLICVKAFLRGSSAMRWIGHERRDSSGVGCNVTLANKD